LCCVAGIVPLAACGQPSAAAALPATHTPTTSGAATPTATPFGAAPPLPGGWQTYRDPRGAFTLQVPQGWSADMAAGQWDSAGGPIPDVDTVLGEPPHGQVTMTFEVAYHALPAALSGCTAPPGPIGSTGPTTTTSVAGLPATYVVNGRHETWSLSVASDAFLLGWSWPGYTGDWPAGSPPSLPDPATWHADQALAHLIVASFRPRGEPTAPCP
jgi:hypothetical protein